MTHYKICPENNEIELYFDKKPEDSILCQLRNFGWKWVQSKTCWHIACTDCALQMAKSFCKNTFKRYCYGSTVSEFLQISLEAWLSEMISVFTKEYTLTLGDAQIRAWEDCYQVLQRELPPFSDFQIVFEYALPYESGRRPDVILLSQESVVVLEFKMKREVLQADLDQVAAYCRDLEEYHYESRNRKITPVLVVTKMSNVKTSQNGVAICSGDRLRDVLSHNIRLDERPCDLTQWVESKYEPLPTIVQSAKMIMDREPLPQIRRVNSTGIPNAIDGLEKVTQYAQKRGKYIIAMVTGVPGAGKTFLGLQFVYNVCKANDQVNSVYLSGNGPLIRVLTDALHSDVFVKDLHKVITEFLANRANDFNSNVIVFDEGQRAWDKNKMKENKRSDYGSEPDIMIRLAEQKLKWCVLLVLVGEGQEINSGENSGLGQWNDALKKGKKQWNVICPDKIRHFFDNENVLRAHCRNDLDLTVSLRSHLAGDVSNFVNRLLDNDVETAKKYLPQIRNAGFTILLTRNLESAKNYCTTRYHGQISRRYGLLASSKEDHFMKKYGVRNSFNDTSLRYMDIGKWYNDDARSSLSCCALKKVVTEFGCQGLELDMPIVCWGPDKKWDGQKWQLYRPEQPANSDENVYRTNSYRVLLTRGRDGMILYIPDDPVMNSTYKLLLSLGIPELKEGSTC